MSSSVIGLLGEKVTPVFVALTVAATVAGPDFHKTTSLDDPFTIINANDNISQYIAFQVIFV